MAPRILVVEHEPQCPPAHLGTWLVEAGAALDVCRPWAGDAVPGLDGYDAYVVLGGSMGAHDDDTHAWLTPVKALAREAVDRGVPTLGVCLGHQLLAVALGGDAARNPRGQQVGVLDVGWLPQAAADPLVGALIERRGPVRGIQWNDDVVTALPDGAVALAQTPAGELQVVRFAPLAWGVQLHPEADEPILRSWAAGDRDDHIARGIDQEALLREIAEAREELEDAWRPLAQRLVALCGTAEEAS